MSRALYSSLITGLVPRRLGKLLAQRLVLAVAEGVLGLHQGVDLGCALVDHSTLGVPHASTRRRHTTWPGKSRGCFGSPCSSANLLGRQAAWRPRCRPPSWRSSPAPAGACRWAARRYSARWR